MSQNYGFIKKKEKHHFHLVENSSLPFLTSFSTFLLVCSFVFGFHPQDNTFGVSLDNILFQFAGSSFLMILLVGFITVLIESDEGHHTLIVRRGLRYGMALFIVSEIMFFFAFFGAFFHVSLSPSIAIGCVGPPKSIQALDIGALPLTNTILLLSSGFATTLAHKSLGYTERQVDRVKFTTFLLIAITLGLIFLACQFIEYKYGITFSGKENIYGSTFFVTTGFHGFHVTIGTLFLIFCGMRASGNIFTAFYKAVLSLKKDDSLLDQIQRMEKPTLNVLNFTKERHVGFEAAAGYGHFVDVVGIFLFLTVYGGGSY